MSYLPESLPQRKTDELPRTRYQDASTLRPGVPIRGVPGQGSLVASNVAENRVVKPGFNMAYDC